MSAQDQYSFKADTDKDVNKLIEWWNNTLFEYGRVMVFDFKEYWDLDNDYQDFGNFWSFELTTDNFEMHIKQDSHHVKSYWVLNLPKPESVLEDR